MPELIPCVRCGHSNHIATLKQDGGHKIGCSCGNFVWSAGTLAEAQDEWDELNTPIQCHYCRTGEGSSCDCV